MGNQIRNHTVFYLRTKEGRNIPFASVTCLICFEIFFTNATSNEYLPVCCPYCGAKAVSIKQQEDLNA